MKIERNEGIKINLKRISRIKKKYNLVTKKRRRNNNKIAQLNNIEHRACTNLLKQSFKADRPGEVFSTDVTYLTNRKGKRAYLSGVKDLCSKDITGFYVSEYNDLKLVIDSVKVSLKKSKKGVIIHSDQGFQYTSPLYQNFLNRNGVIQSMSRRGNCYDNAPIESFFGHMKDECDYKDWETIEELRAKVKRYIKYYNEERPQWGLRRKTPVEYRSFLS